MKNPRKMQLRQWFQYLFRRIRLFGKRPAGKRLIRAGKILLQAAIVLVLVWQILDIGLHNILAELPSQPLFYIIFLMIYFALPVTEFLTYGRHWKLGFWQSQSIFLKKRVYNKTVIGYSGEVQLFFWLQKELGIDRKEAFEVVRDNNTLSTLASTGVAVVLLAIFVASGQLAIFEWIDYRLDVLIPVVAAVLIAAVLIFRKYRQYLFSMTRKEAVPVFLLHTGRMLLLTFLQVLQWYVVMPEVAFEIWFTLVALQLILSRIPFLPNKDLVFIGTSLELGRHVAISPAGLAGILLVHQVLDKIMNLLVFSLLSVRERARRA